MKKENWILTSAKKADPSRNYAILENSEVTSQLDALFKKEFWPFIRAQLRATGYSFPKKSPTSEFEMSYALERSISFMLFDQQKPFFRGTLKCSLESWMLETEFFLSLKKETDPRVLFELLGNSRLAGNPPEMSVHKSDQYYFQIRLHNGEGAGWGRGDYDFVRDRIKKIVETNVKMYEISKTGLISEATVGQFLTTAYDAYEAY